MAEFSYTGGNYFLLLIFFVPFLYLIFKKSKTSKNIPPFPPGPTLWQLLGNIMSHMGKKLHITLTYFSKIHGPLMLLSLGTQKMVVASSPAAAREILKTHDRLFSARYIPKSVPINQEELNHSSIGMTATCNDGWKYLRTLCRAELFSTKTLDAQSCLREKKILEMIEHVKGKNEVNIGDLVFVTVFNMLSNVFFSCDLIGLDEKNEDGGLKGLFMEILESFSGPNIAELYPILSKFDLQGIRKKSMKVKKKVEEKIEPKIQGRRKAKDYSLRQNDFLDVLLLNKFTNARIHQLFIELFSAGVDTSASLIEWTMAELAKCPESMKKVVQELEREIGTCLAKEPDLHKLSYLHVSIKETLRLHPPAPLLLPRRAPETCQVMNYTIPKNAQVYVNIWAMGRDPSIWEEPLMFKPERFWNSSVDFKGNDFEFVPFGAGRRICPGMPMAGRHVPLVLAALLHSFDWSLPKDQSSQELDMTEKFGFTLQKEQPLLLIPKQRK